MPRCLIASLFVAFFRFLPLFEDLGPSPQRLLPSLFDLFRAQLAARLGGSLSFCRFNLSGGLCGLPLWLRLRSTGLRGLTTALDLCMVDPSSESGQANWVRILTALLPYVDLFVPSADELLLMQDRRRYQQMARTGEVADQIGAEEMAALAEWALTRGAKVVVLKASTRGIYLHTGAMSVISSLGKAAHPCGLGQPPVVGSTVQGAAGCDDHRRR